VEAVAPDPSPAGEVVAGQPGVVLQRPINHAVVGEALDGVGVRVGALAAEMMRLACDEAQAAHLPE
jgi:hypothetical protein